MNIPLSANFPNVFFFAPPQITMKNFLIPFALLFLVGSLAETTNTYHFSLCHWLFPPALPPLSPKRTLTACGYIYIFYRSTDIVVKVEKLYHLEGCDDDSGKIEISINDSTTNLDGYFIMVQPEAKSYSSFELTGLEKGQHTIAIFSASGDLLAEKQGIEVEENGQCANFAFKMWKKGGLPGVICLGATLLVLIIVLVYYNKVFAPREEAIRKRDEKRSQERMKRHLHRYRQAKGIRTVDLSNTKVLNECISKNKKNKRSDKKRRDKDVKREHPKQAIETIDVDGGSNANSHKVVTLKRLLPVSKAARIFFDPNNVPEDAITNVPISTFPGVNSTEQVYFPGMSVAIPNCLGYLYAGIQNIRDNHDSWRYSFVKLDPISRGEQNLQPLMPLQPSTAPTVKIEDINFQNTNDDSLYSMDFGTDQTEVMVEENPYTTMMQLEQSENNKIIRSMSRNNVTEEQSNIYTDLVNGDSSDQFSEIEENDSDYSTKSTEEVKDKDDKTSSEDSESDSSVSQETEEIKEPAKQKVEEMLVNADEQVRPEHAPEEHPIVFQSDKPELYEEPDTHPSEAPVDALDLQSDDESIDSGAASGSEAFSSDSEAEVEPDITDHPDPVPREVEEVADPAADPVDAADDSVADAGDTADVADVADDITDAADDIVVDAGDNQEPIALEEPPALVENVEPAPQDDPTDDIAPPAEIPDESDSNELSDEEALPPVPPPIEGLIDQEQPLSENGSIDEE